MVNPVRCEITAKNFNYFQKNTLRWKTSWLRYAVPETSCSSKRLPCNGWWYGPSVAT